VQKGRHLGCEAQATPPGFAEALAICDTGCRCPDEANGRGIIHRDIKPKNIMLTTCNQVKVLDFGLAKVMRDSSDMGADTASISSIPGMVMGTVPYIAICGDAKFTAAYAG
jgi:eukaryotic-like serine/threonine-protein kinase